MSSKSILKSTSLIGGSQLINVLFQLIRTKVVAIILGPSGTGLIGALQASASMVQSFSSLGLGNSSVRDISQAHAKDDEIKLSETIKTLRRVVLITGLLGLLLTLILAGPLSKFTFGTLDYVWPIRLLSVMVFFNLIKEGQGALIQGMRRIKDLALMSVIGAVVSTILAVPIIYLLNMDGVAVYLVLVAIGQFGVAYYFSQKIEVVPIQLSWNETLKNAKGMLQLGLAFMGGGVIGMVTLYLIRVFIIRTIDLEAAGIYQAAMSISGLFINFVLRAMGKDFYPRLAAVANEPIKEIEIINEQTEIGMLVASPGLLFTLALAPYAIQLFYSNEYSEAYPVLQWMILGLFIRTISWPMGFLFIARAKSNYFFWIQVFSNAVHFVFVYLLISEFGVLGGGIAFFALYVLHLIFMSVLVHRENKFRWTPKAIRYIILSVLIFSFSMIILNITDKVTGAIIVSSLGVIVSFFVLKELIKVLGLNSFTEFWIKLKTLKK